MSHCTPGFYPLSLRRKTVRKHLAPHPHQWTGQTASTLAAAGVAIRPWSTTKRACSRLSPAPALSPSGGKLELKTRRHTRGAVRYGSLSHRRSLPWPQTLPPWGQARRHRFFPGDRAELQAPGGSSRTQCLDRWHLARRGGRMKVAGRDKPSTSSGVR